ncbi:hypothetical protein HGA91_02720 [candidate division WWE3 bacterium]|nr:hypothetical protein [candidate division WWE3 bacterium]
MSSLYTPPEKSIIRKSYVDALDDFPRPLKIALALVSIPLLFYFLIELTFPTSEQNIFSKIDPKSTSFAASRTIYVNGKTGNDSWSGTAASPNGSNSDGPVRTVQQGVNLASAGTTISIAEGYYDEEVQIKDKSGTSAEPIIIQGNGNRASVINGGKKSTGWDPAPEIGTGVYKKALGFEPQNLTWNDIYIVRINSSRMAGTDWPGLIKNGPGGSWVYAKGLFGYKDGITYLKLDNGADPDTADIRVAKLWEGTISFSNSHYIQLKNITVKNAYNAVIYWSASSHNSIENSLLIGGSRTVAFRDNSGDTKITGNTITLGYSHDLSPYRDHSWDIWGLMRSIGDGVRYGIGSYEGGDNIEIANNDINQHFVAIGYDAGRSRTDQPEGAANWIIHDNLLHNNNHVAISVGGSSKNYYIYRNKVWECFTPLRFQDPRVGPVYIYQNTFSFGSDEYVDPAGSADAYMVYNWAQTKANIFVYQNSFSAPHGRMFSYSRDPNSEDPTLVDNPNMYFINNIFSTQVMSGKPLGSHFEYNFIANSKDVSGTNIDGSNTPLWNDADSTLQIASTSIVRNKGIDLSKSFVLNGKTFAVLPGMSSFYRNDGQRPDLGAFQFSSSNTPIPTLTIQPTSSPKPTVTPTPTMVITPTSVPSPTPSISPKLTLERWNTIQTPVNARIIDLLNDGRYPNEPDQSSLTWSIDTAKNTGDYFGIRIRGTIVPQITGSYTFYVSGDDTAELWLGTNDQSSSAQKIAYTERWTNPYEWNKYSTQKSEAIQLVANQKYYLGILMAESISADHVAVGWTLPGHSTIEVIPPQYFETMANEISGDINRDGIVDVFDLGILAAHYGQSVLTSSDAITKACDINSDTQISIYDLGILVGQYHL